MRRTTLLAAKLVSVIVFVVVTVAAVAGTSYVVGVSLFGAGDPTAVVNAIPHIPGDTSDANDPAADQGGGVAAPVPAAPDQSGIDSVSSLSGAALSPADLTARLLGAMGYITISMLGVGAIALFLSTVTASSLGATLGALAALITSQVLVTLDAATSVTPYLPTRYWLAWVDFFRDPIFLRDITAGLWLQAGYVVVLMLAAWANFATKDVTS